MRWAATQWFGEIEVILEFNAFFFRVMDLLDTGGHFSAAAAIDDADFFGSQAQRGPHAVHRGVAAADHRHVAPPHHGGVGLGELVRLHQVRPGEVLVRRIDADQVDAGNAREMRQARPRADEHRVVAQLVEEVVHREGAADYMVHLQLDADEKTMTDWPLLMLVPDRRRA